MQYSKILTIFLISIGAILIMSSGAIANDVIVVDDRAGEGDTNTLEEAIQMVSDEGTIIIRESQDIKTPYEGTKIGTEDDILNNGKSITIRGEGVVGLKSPTGQDSVIEIARNEKREITIENIMFLNAKHAIEAKSDSNIVVRDISIGSTITDKPFLFNDNVQGIDGVGGATITDYGVYYPNGQSTLEEDVVGAETGDVSLDIIGNDPTGLIYDRQKEALRYNPVTASNYDGEIIVGSPTEELDESDDYNMETNFYSIQAAVDAASSDSVISVNSRDEPYGVVEFNGIGTSGNSEITIRNKTSPNSALPRVEGFVGNYPGEYDIRNMQIMNEVVANSDGVDIDASNNYWMSSEGPTSTSSIIPTGTSANILVEPYCVDDRCQNEFTFSNLNQCVEIEAVQDLDNKQVKYGCEDNTEYVNITIGEFIDISNSSRIELYDFDTTDFRESNVYVETNSNQRVNIEINVVASDNPVDAEITVPAEDNSTGLIEAQFASIIKELDVGESQSINTRAYVTINNNQPFVIDLDSTTVEGVGENTGIVELPDTVGQTRGSIQSNEFEGVIRDETTYVSRFNANNEDSTAFQDDIIPPTKVINGETRNTARGTIENFEELRTEPGKAAIIRPENPLNVGMAVQGISNAKSHTLSITYALQGNDNPQNYVDVKLMNSQSSEIYNGRTDAQSQLEITTTSDEPYYDSGGTENLETRTKQIQLEPSEIDYVNQNGELYVVFNSEDIDIDTVLYLYNVEVKTTDAADDVEDNTNNINDGSESVASNPEERPGSFTISFNVNGNKNAEYDSYDVEPGEDLTSTVIIENAGDTTIDSTFALVDNYETPKIRFPNEDELTSEIQITENEIDRFSIRVAGGERESIPVSHSWDETEFGNHTVKFVEVDGDGNYRNINEKDGLTPQFDAYVFQTATFEITEVDVPEEHLTYDNFNSEVKLHNIGDLSGTRKLYTEFGSWESERSFGSWESERSVSLAGGNARAGTTSEETTVRFSRDIREESGSQYDFTFREYTTIADVISSPYSNAYSGPFEIEDISYDSNSQYHRPDAPFGLGLEEGVHRYKATVNNEFRGNLFSQIIASVLTSEVEEEVSLNNIVINDLNVVTKSGGLSQRPTAEEATIYASAYPYVQPSYGIRTGALTGESYVKDDNVRGGFSTMYSYNADVDDNPLNRGATPLNLEGIDSVTQPNNRYFSTYYSHQNRFCNPDLLAGANSDTVQVPESEADESDTTVFLPYSANKKDDNDLCDDEDRYVSLQMPRFAGTTDAGTENTTNVQHPDGEFTIDGVNQETFHKLEENGNIMYAVATISNPSSSQPATARFEIRTNKSTNARGHAVGLGESGDHQNVQLEENSFDDNVVGVAAVELRPQETLDVYVPVIIKNDVGNEGVHILSIHPRSKNDYIRRTDGAEVPTEMEQSPLTNDYHSQFQVPINVTTYGDGIITEIEPVESRWGGGDDPTDAQSADLVVNEVCTSDVTQSIENRGQAMLRPGSSYPDLVEGLNPKSGFKALGTDYGFGVVRDDGTCNNSESTDETVAKFESQYTNFGGSPVTIQPEALAEFEARESMTVLHRNSAHSTGDRLFANYESNTDVGTNAEINAVYTANGDEIGFAEEVVIQTGETMTFGFEREFQEPGLYHIRHSPCRQITETGPKHYNLEGFTGIIDSIDSPGQNGDRDTWIENHNRTNSNLREFNTFTTNEVQYSAFHGAKGCDDVKSSVFVYDITNPVADFRIAESDSAVKSSSNTNSESKISTQVPDDALTADEREENVHNDFEVYEGGMLLFDGSTQDCPNCYESGIPNHDTSVPDVTDWNNRAKISINTLKKYRMSQVNTIITDMIWNVNGNAPNFGNSELCNEVTPSKLDEHCYMETFSGNNNYEVIAHRFHQVGNNELKLQVWDDEELTEGESNTNITTHNINVVDDTNDPSVTMNYDRNNDLTYAGDTESDNGNTIWHRNENVIQYTSLDDFDDTYYNTYEGIRSCLSVTASDGEIGIAQDAWYNLGDSTLVTDAGIYTYNLHGGTTDYGDVDVSNTRAGDKRCIVFEETDSSGDKARTQTFEYKAWDFSGLSDEDSVDITVSHDGDAPSIGFSNTYSGQFDHNNLESYVWAADSSTGYSGSDVDFSASATEDGVGIACMDLLAIPANTNCQSMADEAAGSFDVTYSAKQLGYDTEQYETEEMKVTDWHSNTATTDITDINVLEDDSKPSFDCDPNDCYSEYVAVDGDPNSYELDTWDNSDESTTCVEINNKGHDGGTGLDISTLDADGGDVQGTSSETSVEVCVTAEADPEADSPEADAGPVDCEEEDVEKEWDYDDEDETVTADVSVDDYHGNTRTVTIEAYAEADAYDSDYDSVTGSDCPEDDEE